MKIEQKVILLDIEGTVGPVTFVHKVMFPLAAEKLPGFLSDYTSNGAGEEMNSLRALFKSEGVSFAEEKDFIQAATARLLDYIKQDKKDTILKAVQGKIWKSSFESGELRGELYKDVLPALKQWKNEGKTLAIFSSGSVQAQKLYFKYSSEGDLSSYISGYFDTVTGPKKEKQTYIKIAEELNVSPEEIMFFTDMEAEAEAAIAAGVCVKILDREGSLNLQNRNLQGLVISGFAPQ